MSFDKAKLDPIPFPNGKAVIKKVRCKVAAGRGYLTPEKAIEIQKHNFLSIHDYKHHIYAQNDQNTYCLYYESEFNNDVERAFRIVGLFELSRLGIKNEKELFQDNYYNKIETGRGNNKKLLPLVQILKVGTKVIFYNEHIEELKELPKKELLKRIFRIYKFNEKGTLFVYLQNHIEASKNDSLGDGDKRVDLKNFQPRVYLSPSNFICAIESKHFEIKPDGEINWKI
jgi:CRISPR-associated endonuclease Csn1